MFVCCLRLSRVEYEGETMVSHFVNKIEERKTTASYNRPTDRPKIYTFIENEITRIEFDRPSPRSRPRP